MKIAARLLGSVFETPFFEPNKDTCTSLSCIKYMTWSIYAPYMPKKFLCAHISLIRSYCRNGSAASGDHLLFISQVLVIARDAFR